MPGFAKMGGVAVGSDGMADPQTQLFRNSAMGVQTGPMISQVQCGLPPIVQFFVLLSPTWFRPNVAGVRVLASTVCAGDARQII